MSSTLCRYFLHGACKQGDNCSFSHDLQSKPSMVCKYYLQGSCSYGKRCRYDHHKPHTPVTFSTGYTEEIPRKMTPLFKNSGREHGYKENFSREDTWIYATEFVPGKKSHGTTDNEISEFSSYASAAHAGTVPEDAGTLEPINIGDQLLCPYLSLQDCPDGNSCEYLHALQCDVCDEYCLHPLDEEQQLEHRRECLDAMEKEMEYSFAVQRSTSVVCSICLENVTEKVSRPERLFGIMENCCHPFCLGCIRKWRGSGQQDALVLRACPICRVPSGFVTPSDVWVEDEEEKRKIIEQYKEVLRSKPCRYFDQGKGSCPFGSSCFYKHALPDGTLERKSPDLRFYAGSECDSAVIRDHNLWQFIEARDLRQYEP